jgi:hypothetical protein
MGRLLAQFESRAAREWRRNQARIVRGYIGPKNATKGVRYLELSAEQKQGLQRILARAFRAHRKKWAEKTREAREHLDALHKTGFKF